VKDHRIADIPSKTIDTVYVLGRKHWGRTNNQIIEVVNSVDRALDDGNAVVALRGWALPLLQHLIFDTRNSTEWAIQLENLEPSLSMVDYHRLEELNLTESNNVSIIELDTEEIFLHKLNTAEEKKVQRHKFILSSLFQKYISKQNLDGYHAVQKELQRFNVSKQDDQRQQKHIKYTVIHSRWMEGQCYWRIERLYGKHHPKDECHMYPSYIKAILGTPILQPIVFITDGQNNQTQIDLQRDPDIGPMLIVQSDLMNSPRMNDEAENDLYYVLNDMLVAIMSDTFIGTRVSSFANNVGRIRRYLGADPESNFIYVEINGTAVENCVNCWNYSQLI
jgi:hypothetical protein